MANATTVLNDLQLYLISINHFRGNLLWAFQTWHTSLDEALAYGNQMAAKHYADEPACVIRVSAQLA
jgi:hypothetical protein